MAMKRLPVRLCLHHFSQCPRPHPPFYIFHPSTLRQKVPQSTAIMSTSSSQKSHSVDIQDALPFGILGESLHPALHQALRAMNFFSMTPVQAKVLQGLPKFTSDCLVQAKTGTGKTTAFLLPAIQGTLEAPPQHGQVAILVLSPTRELGSQIAAEASQLVAKMKKPFEIHTAFGGNAKASALQKFMKGNPSILVATPGRLNDYLSEAVVRRKFENMRTLILDEADRMLDAGFLPAVREILKSLPPKYGSKGQWQGMAFSATIPPSMRPVFEHVLSKDHTSISTIDPSETPTVALVPQFSVVIPGVEATFTGLDAALSEEIRSTAVKPKIIVFGITANLVSLFAKVFKDQVGALPVFELHSRLSQSTRTKTTDSFKKATSGVLFASDVVGRGMDFPDVSLVIQMGLPADSDAYIHRVGRTGRAGKGGRALIILTEAESFFLAVNRQFPIKQHPAHREILNSLDTGRIVPSLEVADPEAKRKAYSSYLGFMKGFMNKLRLTPTELVQMANRLATKAMLCNGIPEMEKKTIGKMGLKGVSGLNVVSTIRPV